MSNSRKIALGILSILPIILLAVFLTNLMSFLWHFFKETSLNATPDEFMFSNFRQVAGMIISTILLALVSLGVMVFYMVHAINNHTITRDERIIWVLVFIFVGVVTYPVYWYIRIWNTREPIVPV